ncbi:hypothetical protein V2A60_007186 [Cordyceps javanica]
MKSALIQGTAGLMLAVQVLASAIERPAAGNSTAGNSYSNSTALSPRTGCNQSDCPDSRFGFDMFSSWSQFFWYSHIRWWGACDCQKFFVHDDGCATFSICTGTHSVCVDYRKGRAHWVDPNGHKTCYSMRSEYICGSRLWASWPTNEVACTW